MNEREAYIALNMMEKVGPVSVRALKAQLGSAQAIFEADELSLQGAQGVGTGLARVICEQRASIDWQAEMVRADDMGCHIVTQEDEDYPAPLREIHDPPLALYVQGRLESRDKNSIAVVGTRRPSVYGRSCAESLASQIARAGMVVVSGLAEGIDTAAHLGCLKAKGRTIAVLGSALDCLYPPSNRGLALRIAETGVVMSEFPFGREPDKTTFPMRNRIVSGLSLGTVVVEAGDRSGALITATQANEQGRTVFAVPGRIDSPVARGPHRLIRDGARLVERVDDILEELEFMIPRERGTAHETATAELKLTDVEATVIELLEEGGLGVDTLIRRASLAAAQVNSVLIGLEMKRLIRMLPGRIVERVR